MNNSTAVNLLIMIILIVIVLVIIYYIVTTKRLPSTRNPNSMRNLPFRRNPGLFLQI